MRHTLTSLSQSVRGSVFQEHLPPNICSKKQEVMSPLKIFRVAWSVGAFSAVQTLLNDHRRVIGYKTSAVCLLYDPLAPSRDLSGYHIVYN